MKVTSSCLFQLLAKISRIASLAIQTAPGRTARTRRLAAASPNQPKSNTATNINTPYRRITRQSASISRFVPATNDFTELHALRNITFEHVSLIPFKTIHSICVPKPPESQSRRLERALAHNLGRENEIRNILNIFLFSTLLPQKSFLWTKPGVPRNPYKLKNCRRDSCLIVLIRFTFIQRTGF